MTGRGRGGEGRGNVIGERRRRTGAETSAATHTAQAEVRLGVNLVL